MLLLFYHSRNLQCPEVMRRGLEAEVVDEAEGEVVEEVDDFLGPGNMRRERRSD